MSEPDPPYSGAPAASRRRSEQYYRERAQELREFAARTPNADVRQDLLALSLRYDHLAQRAKTIAEKVSASSSRAAEDRGPPDDSAEATQPE